MASRSIGKRAGSRSTSSRNRRRPQPAALSAANEEPQSDTHHPRAKKSLGQHFLSDPNILHRIVSSAELTSDDVVIEIGPGRGALTDLLVQASRHLIAVETDDELAALLDKRFASRPDVTLINDDILMGSPEQCLEEAGLPVDTPYSVVANLPYNIGAAVIRLFLEAENQPTRMVAMLQKEVAASITASPGELGLLGVSVQVYARARRLFNVAPGAFSPPPNVMSTVLRLDIRDEPLVPLAEREHFFAVVRAGFSAPRKQLRNSLAQGLKRSTEDAGFWLTDAGLQPDRRPETLSVEDWRRLAVAVPDIR